MQRGGLAGSWPGAWLGRTAGFCEVVSGRHRDRQASSCQAGCRQTWHPHPWTSGPWRRTRQRSTDPLEVGKQPTNTQRNAICDSDLFGRGASSSGASDSDQDSVAVRTHKTSSTHWGCLAWSLGSSWELLPQREQTTPFHRLSLSSPLANSDMLIKGVRR